MIGVGRFMAPTRLAPVAAILLFFECGAAVPQPIRHPSWLAPPDRPSPILRISQSASFEGARLHVCRRLENITSQPLLIRNLEPDGDNNHELTVAFYDRSGGWIAPPRPPGFHPTSVPPPPPAYEGDVSIYAVLAPSQSAENCKAYDVEPGLSVFQVVTYYMPSVFADRVPSRFAAGKLLMTRDLGSFASQPCLVNVARHHVECAPRSPAANRPSTRVRNR